MYSLESHHLDNSNECTQHIFFMIKYENFPKIFQNCLFSVAFRRISSGFKNEFELAVVNKPLMFESLKFYCTVTTLINSNSKGTELFVWVYSNLTKNSLKNAEYVAN